jgi:hypothetical protein
MWTAYEQFVFSAANMGHVENVVPHTVVVTVIPLVVLLMPLTKMWHEKHL